jgi:hypothetical protein
MRFAALIVAGFCVLVSIGDVFILFILPATSIPLTPTGAGSNSAAAQSWEVLLLLLLAVAASVGVLLSLKRDHTARWPKPVSALVTAASLVAIADYGISRHVGRLGPQDIPWLNITIIVVAVLYLANRPQWRSLR